MAIPGEKVIHGDVDIRLVLDKNLSYQLGLLAQYGVIVTCHTYSIAAFGCLVLHQYLYAAD